MANHVYVKVGVNVIGVLSHSHFGPILYLHFKKKKCEFFG